MKDIKGKILETLKYKPLNMVLTTALYQLNKILLVCMYEHTCDCVCVCVCVCSINNKPFRDKMCAIQLR